MSFSESGPVPVLAPPPRSPLSAAYTDGSPRFNPFDKSGGFAQEATLPTEAALPSEMTRTDSQVIQLSFCLLHFAFCLFMFT
jgi:hypothetical protein